MSHEDRDGGEILRDELARRGWSLRGFARMLAGPDADTRAIERERRMLYRIIDGGRVEPESAARLAGLLDVDATPFEVRRPEPIKDLGVRRRLREVEDQLAAIHSSRDEQGSVFATALEATRDRLDAHESRIDALETALNRLARELPASRGDQPTTGSR